MQEQNIEIPEIKFPQNSTEEGAVMAPRIRFGGSVRRKKIIVRGIAFVLAILVFLGIAIGVPGVTIYNKAKVLEVDAKNLKDSFGKQNINDVETSLQKLKTDLVSFQSSYNLLSWTKFMPIMGAYWSDGEAAIKGGLHGLDAAQIGVTTAKPYADIIGFAGTGGEAQNAEENANDRIEFLVSTIKDILPKVDEVSNKANLAKQEFDKIDPNRYPEKIGDKKVRENLRTLLNMVDEGATLVTNSKPLLEVAPYLMGVDGDRTYLLIFQNDKELRPTGGFITGYSVMNVSKGKVSNVSSNDIYNLDKNYTPTIKAPEPIVKYLKGPYLISQNLRLRDMNFDSDYKVSMDMFLKEARKAGIPDVDGVIAVDTQALVNLLNALGEVGVPGYGNFSTKIIPECNCPQVIYELESFADVEGSIVWDQNDPTKIIFAPANYLNRKEIVGPLMNSLLRNALGQPKEKLQGLFQAAWDSLTQKHVLFYMNDEKAQKGVESFNIAGRVKDYDGDYFLATDANLGGRKSNLYVTNEIEQDIEISSDGSVTKTVILTYKNPEKHDGWLNSVLPSWLRIYVPKGSQLISLEGLDDKKDPYEELGKTVFSGSYSLRPEGLSKITVKYKLPFKAKGEYKLLMQKQPGIDTIVGNIKVGRQQRDLFLKMDQEFKFKI